LQDKGFVESSDELPSTPSQSPAPEDSSNSYEHEQEDEHFTWARWLKIGIVIAVFLAAAVRNLECIKLS